MTATAKSYAEMTDEEFAAQAAKEEEARKARIAAGEEDPADVYPIPRRTRRKRKPAPPPPDDSCTQKVNGLRFAEMFAGRLRYLTDREVWFRWDDNRWTLATDGDLLRAAKVVVDGLLVEAYAEQDEDRRKRLIGWALACCTVHQMQAMVKMATSEQVLESKAADFDRHPDFLNVANGTIDLRGGALFPHRRDTFITRLVPISYDPTATCPRWLQFLDEVFAGDKQLIAFVQRAVGYSLTGHTREHAFFILFGNGMNGKGRFIRQVMGLLGDAARTTAFGTFTAKRDDGGEKNTPALASLYGARLVVAGEPDEGVRLSESVIKLLTGDDEIEVCAKYESPFRYTPQFKLWLHTNYKPEIRGTDNGIWRRPRLIPFTVSFEGRADKSLDEKLDAERAGILAWAVQGAREWFANGLGECETVTNATKGYRQESDALGSFIEDCVHVDADHFTSNAELYRVYQRWCEANGTEPWAANTFSLKFKARGYHAKKVKGVRGVVGIDVEMPSQDEVQS